ncbi:hypothetical protein ACFL5O_00215 [Myxococcota bacterium]
MWVRSSAIRPVSAFARVPAHALDAVRDGLSEDDDEARSQLDEAFEHFERAQPDLASYVADSLSRPLDDVALALGYFLVLTVWLAFEHVHRGHIDRVSEEQLRATQQLVELDEEIRRADPAEALDTEDVVAMEQPHLLAFVHEHVEATLEARVQETDVDDVHQVYRLVLVEVLALSYAVERPAGYPVGKTELLA